VLCCPAADCDGHGTHVSSTAAGRSVGVAREARVMAVRVLDCDGAGSISNVVAGKAATPRLDVPWPPHLGLQSKLIFET
jgi:subtilisin family serine protease